MNPKGENDIDNPCHRFPLAPIRYRLLSHLSPWPDRMTPALLRLNQPTITTTAMIIVLLLTLPHLRPTSAIMCGLLPDWSLVPYTVTYILLQLLQLLGNSIQLLPLFLNIYFYSISACPCHTGVPYKEIVYHLSCWDLFKNLSHTWRRFTDFVRISPVIMFSECTTRFLSSFVASLLITIAFRCLALSRSIPVSNSTSPWW